MQKKLLSSLVCGSDKVKLRDFEHNELYRKILSQYLSEEQIIRLFEFRRKILEHFFECPIYRDPTGLSDVYYQTFSDDTGEASLLTKSLSYEGFNGYMEKSSHSFLHTDTGKIDSGVLVCPLGQKEIIFISDWIGLHLFSEGISKQDVSTLRGQLKEVQLYEGPEKLPQITRETRVNAVGVSDQEGMDLQTACLYVRFHPKREESDYQLPKLTRQRICDFLATVESELSQTSQGLDFLVHFDRFNLELQNTILTWAREGNFNLEEFNRLALSLATQGEDYVDCLYTLFVPFVVEDEGLQESLTFLLQNGTRYKESKVFKALLNFRNKSLEEKRAIITDERKMVKLQKSMKSRWPF